MVTNHCNKKNNGDIKQYVNHNEKNYNGNERTKLSLLTVTKKKNAHE